MKQSLLDRLRAGSGPDPDLDRAVWHYAFGPGLHVPAAQAKRLLGRFFPQFRQLTVPNLTGCTDAAVRFVETIGHRRPTSAIRRALDELEAAQPFNEHVQNLPREILAAALKEFEPNL